MTRFERLPFVALALALLASAGGAQEKKEARGDGKVSFDRQIRPIFQAHCVGCHQPAKAKGNYVMTVREKLLAAADEGKPNVVPGDPAKSFLVAQIVLKPDGKADMPKGRPPLAAAEIELVRKWIAEGAVDDTPSNAVAKFDMHRPPVYTRQPVVSSLDFSPDGSLLAVAGFHEVLLFKADGSERVARLVGLSERIQAVSFSPDGKQLAAAGGLPGRSGEIQVWDLEKKTLALSIPVTHDTVNGVSWSPDGKLLAVGCADFTVRAFDAKSGDPVVYNLSHSDWSLDTVFSADGSHVVSVGRDGAVKLIEVATQRFVDNVTSITPGALKGGIAAVTRHPKRDEIVIGGDDGRPRVYRIHRLVERKIGDDSNLVRELPAIAGRLWGLAVSPDGKRIAAGSGVDGKGEVATYSYEFDTALPENIKAIMRKEVSGRNGDERKVLSDYHHKDVKQLGKAAVPQAIVYAVAFRPDGAVFAAAGSDGVVRLFETETCKPAGQFAVASVEAAAAKAADRSPALRADDRAAETLPPGAKVAALEVLPAQVRLPGRFEAVQLVVTARLQSGESIDVTRMAAVQAPAEALEVTRGGLVQPKADAKGALEVSLDGKSASVPFEVSGLAAEDRHDFIRDVNPVLSRIGCNAGTCHGAQKGRNGFKLSLRGYDALLDVRSLTDDLASRRVAVASPDDSLMLLKTTGAVPHEGARLILPGDPYYRILRGWVAQGATLDVSAPRVTKIEVQPLNPVIERLGARQQMRVVATYADGRVKDVTREAFVESGNTEVASADRAGMMTAIRRGEASVLARYEGAYAATTLTVMGDRKGFVWADPPSYGTVDDLVAAKWKRMRLLPSDVCDDATFIRRAHLDLTGLPPSSDAVRAFLADSAEPRAKREALVTKLIGSDAWLEHWTNKWADLLQVNRKFLGSEGAAEFRKWIRAELARNTPYDEFARKIIAADGSNRENPAASYYKILRDPDATTENTTHLFLAVRFNCSKCHDHPFERWTQDQYYETAAFFARVGLKADPESKGRNIGGTAVEGAKPFYEIVYEKSDGEVTHQRTGVVTPPKFPFDCAYQAPEKATRRQQLAAWMTSKDNPYFARSFVNRLWGYLFGVGIIEPIDDIRAGNPPTNPQLLDHLTSEFVKSGFDVRHVMRLMATSRTYQLSVATNEWNKDDRTNYSHAYARRLPAEVLFDAIHAVTGAASRIPGVPAGTRAAALPDSGVELPSGFLGTLGRPARESACECERTTELRLGAVMALISGPVIGDALADPGNELAKLVGREKDDAKLVDEVFMRVLNRPARPKEIEAALAAMSAVKADHARLASARDAREAWWKETQPRLEQERADAMAKAKAAAEAREQEIAPQVAEAEKQRQEQIAAREKDVKDHETRLPEAVAAWEKKQKPSGDWTPVVPVKLEANAGGSLAVQDDLSILASGKNGKGTYVVTAHTDLKGIVAVRLEALQDDRSPAKGPGRAPDGNFVLVAFDVTAAPKSDPAKAAKLALQNARADFSQKDFDVKFAVDGQGNTGRGWAVSPATGSTHWATFELKEPVGHEGGTVLTFSLRQNFNANDYLLGRFRISVTTVPGVGLGLSDELRAIVSTPSAARTDVQKERLLSWYRKIDPELTKRNAALAEAKKPLPVDPALLALRETLAIVSKPVPLDPELAQLRADTDQSAKQTENPRLAMAQDLAWSLINSPAFLFNR
jgi:WD40 repeat protein